jgi:hypothetical protein
MKEMVSFLKNNDFLGFSSFSGSILREGATRDRPYKKYPDYFW